MITQLEALDFKCLRDLQRPLETFHVLVGPNASGKTTFLDIVGFLADVVDQGLEAAVEARTSNPEDLVWSRSGQQFQLALEASIPESIRGQLAKPEHDTIRYEVAITTTPELSFHAEKVLLHTSAPIALAPADLFPRLDTRRRNTLLHPGEIRGGRTIVDKVADGNDNFYAETEPEAGKGWTVGYKLGRRKSALGNLPEDESKFPASTWLKRLLTEGVQRFILNSLLIRKASPPGQVRSFKPDGSNLPWVIAEMEKNHPERLTDWIAHLQTALPDLEGLRTVERADDRHRYLVLRYRGGLDVPSWMASDGTLRLLALTLPAYLPDFRGVYLIEEPENGIHPRAVETMFQSLSSVYEAQILLATHSPVILSLVRPEAVLCLAKTAEGATDIIRSSEHPALRDWKKETSLGTLFAAGVLG